MILGKKYLYKTNILDLIMILFFQCCNDVVNDRFPDLKGDTILKLAALQIQQHAISSNASGKINLKAIE